LRRIMKTVRNIKIWNQSHAWTSDNIWKKNFGDIGPTLAENRNGAGQRFSRAFGLRLISSRARAGCADRRALRFATKTIQFAITVGFAVDEETSFPCFRIPWCPDCHRFGYIHKTGCRAVRRRRNFFSKSSGRAL